MYSEQVARGFVSWEGLSVGFVFKLRDGFRLFEVCLSEGVSAHAQFLHGSAGGMYYFQLGKGAFLAQATAIGVQSNENEIHVSVVCYLSINYRKKV